MEKGSVLWLILLVQIPQSVSVKLRKLTFANNISEVFFAELSVFFLNRQVRNLLVTPKLCITIRHITKQKIPSQLRAQEKIIQFHITPETCRRSNMFFMLLKRTEPTTKFF